MFTVVITEKGGAQRRMGFDKSEVTIGRVQGNDIILPKGNVSKRHSRIVLKDNRFIVVDLKSTNGTYVNGRKITSPLVVKPGDKIYIGDFILTVEESAEAGGFAEPPAASPEPAPPPEQRQRKRTMQSPPPLSGGQAAAPPVQQPRTSAPPPLPPREPAPPQPQPQAQAQPAPQPSQQDRFPLEEEPQEEAPAPQPAPQAQPRPQPAPRQPAPQQQQAPPPQQQAAPAVRPMAGGEAGALRTVMMHVASQFDVSVFDPAALHDHGRWQQAQQIVEKVLNQLANDLGNVDRAALADAAVKESVGLGALEHLLSDDSIREIVVEGPNRIVADFGRGLEPTAGVFSSADALAIVARRLVAQAGDTLDPTRPIHESALPYGPHVTVVLPPVAVRGPIIEIRRMARGLSTDALTERGMMSPAMVDLLRKAIAARRNVAVTGSVGSGVTTVLGALAGLAGESERIVTVEDVPDLSIQHDNVISLSTATGASGLHLKEVLQQASRLRADRLVVDDVRGAEAFDVLAELSSSGMGNLVGVHCGSGVDSLQGLAKLGSRADAQTVSNLVATAVQVLIEVDRDDDGTRRVTRVSEITGANGTSVTTKDLFVFDGDFSATGKKASFK